MESSFKRSRLLVGYFHPVDMPISFVSFFPNLDYTSLHEILSTSRAGMLCQNNSKHSIAMFQIGDGKLRNISNQVFRGGELEFRDSPAFLLN
jgi:hypothetical protein